MIHVFEDMNIFEAICVYNQSCRVSLLWSPWQAWGIFDTIACTRPRGRMFVGLGFARIAQLVERPTDTRKVLGSTPSARTKYRNTCPAAGFLILCEAQRCEPSRANREPGSRNFDCGGRRNICDHCASRSSSAARRGRATFQRPKVS